MTTLSAENRVVQADLSLLQGLRPHPFDLASDGISEDLSLYAEEVEPRPLEPTASCGCTLSSVLCDCANTVSSLFCYSDAPVEEVPVV